MSRGRFRWALRAGLGGILLVGMALLAGCGQPDEGSNPCEGKTCQFGVCNPAADGACTNPPSCRVDRDCRPGFSCNAQGTCVGEQSCSRTGDCQAGVCREGVCVNPDSCEVNGDCLEGTYCGIDGSCQPDPCNDKECERGTCQRGTGQCVSADSCSRATQYADCIPGEKCADGTCKTEEEFCGQKTCRRGVCSFEELGCVQADDCQGDDARCKEGFMCNDMNRCVANPCQRGDVDCEGRGQCDPATGMCENTEPCSSNADCANDPAHVCVGGTCKLEASACGDAGGDGGCPGNQICQYSAEAVRANCVAPEQCETSIDCTGDLRCTGRDCVAPAQCRPDRFEQSGGGSSMPTTFTDVAKQNAIDASLCQGDTDTYAFDTTAMVDASTTGEIVVDLHIPRVDVGLGPVEVALKDADGNTVASESLAANVDERSVRLTTELTDQTHGSYTVEVGTDSSMSKAGVSYQLSVNIASQSLLDACEMAEPLEVGTLVSGDTSKGVSSRIDSSCVAGAGAASEKVYALQVDGPREIAFTLKPTFSDVDVSLSLRSRCTEPVSEQACVEEAGPSENETLTALLGEGTHYVIVESPGADSGGAFTLETRRVSKKRCTSSDDYCSGSVTANRCVQDGGRYEQIACEIGCNASTGRCYPPSGNVCGGAEVITGDASKGFDLREHTDNYDVAMGGCLGSDPRSGGPDKVYALEIPAQTSVSVRASYSGEVRGALYLSETCGDIAGTCQTGAQGTTSDVAREMLNYSNGTDNTQTRYLVVDSGAGQNLGTVDLDIRYQSVSCMPGTTRCGPSTGNVQECNPYGTGFQTLDACGQWPCASSTCQRADNCSEAPNITQAAGAQGGTQFTLFWGEYSNTFEADDTCGGSAGIDTGQTKGHDAIFEVDLKAGEVLEAKVSGSGDYALYAKGSSGGCGSLNSSCRASDVATGGTPAEFSRYVAAAETVYLVVDTANGAAPDGATLDVDVKQSICKPGEVSCGSGDVQYCEQPGLSQNAFPCDSNGCSNGRCVNPQADHCWDARDLTSTLGSGNVDLTTSWSGQTNYYTDSGCSDIDGSDTGGPEAIYRVDLSGSAAGSEQLTATLSSTDGDYSIYVTDEASCGESLSGSTCLADASASGGNDAQVTYTAGTSNETIYLVVERASGNSGDFTLKASTQTVCTLGSGSCSSGGDLNYCPFSTVTTTSSCSNCCSSATGASAKPGSSWGFFGGVTETLSVPSCAGTTSKVLVGVETNAPEGNHTYTITSPQGTSVELANNGGGCCDSGDDEVEVYPITSSSKESMSKLFGEDPSGSWELKVDGLFGGTLKRWFVTVSCN